MAAVPDAISATQLAHAKLTLWLRVIGVRHDGYHLIDAEMVSLDLADELRFGPGTGITLRGPATGTVTVGPDNLVARALAAVGRTSAVQLTKRIPAGGDWAADPRMPPRCCDGPASTISTWQYA